MQIGRWGIGVKRSIDIKKHSYLVIPFIVTLAFIVGGCGGGNQTTLAPTNATAATGPGTVRVLTFNDVNGNGQADSNEPGMQAQISLAAATNCPGPSDSLKAKTGTDGTYIFNGVTPGAYCVNMLEPLKVTSPLNVKVNVMAGQESSVQFAILADR